MNELLKWSCGRVVDVEQLWRVFWRICSETVAVWVTEKQDID